tara:strand:- start:98 stop:523 length:426 start_codon:yes stop_codon:yes gene_type:complete
MTAKAESVDVKTNAKMSLKHFQYEEFDSPDLPNSGATNMDRNFLSMLDDARGIAGIPFKISSGYRTDKYNQSLSARGYSASPNSSHLKGEAADIVCKNSADRWTILTALQKAGLRRIGIASSFIHVDSSDLWKSSPVIWTY